MDMVPADEQRFLDLILANPEDEASRLAYADWLDGRDDPRGEFIRVDIAYYHLGSDEPGFKAVADRRASLLKKHEKTWLKPLKDLGLKTKMSYGPSTVSYDRGLVSWLSIEEKTQLTSHKLHAVVQAYPFLREIYFSENTCDFATLVNSPDLARLTGLHLQSIDSNALKLLLTSPNLSGLRALSISGRPLSAEDTALLAGSESLEHLDNLGLDYCKLGADGLAALFQRARPWKLKKLSFASSEIGPEAALLFASGKVLPDLEELGLGGAELGPEGMESLEGRMTNLSKLKTLDLSSNALGPDGCVALSKFLDLPSLQSLNLQGNCMQYDGAEALAHSRVLAGLKILNLQDNQLDEDGFALLATSPHLGSMEELSLEGNRIGDNGMALLASRPEFRGLRKLNVRGNSITDRGITALAESPNLMELTELNLSNNRIGANGAGMLARAANLAKLTCLWLEDCSLDEEGEELLKERFGDALFQG